MRKYKITTENLDGIRKTYRHTYFFALLKFMFDSFKKDTVWVSLTNSTTHEEFERFENYRNFYKK